MQAPQRAGQLSQLVLSDGICMRSARPHTPSQPCPMRPCSCAFLLCPALFPRPLSLARPPADPRVDASPIPQLPRPQPRAHWANEIHRVERHDVPFIEQAAVPYVECALCYIIAENDEMENCRKEVRVCRRAARRGRSPVGLLEEKAL